MKMIPIEIPGRREALSRIQSLIALPLKIRQKWTGNFNFTPVKNFDAEEVELLEKKRLKMSLVVSFEKEISKKKKIAVFKVRKDTIYSY
jgi:hypothetical protein